MKLWVAISRLVFFSILLYGAFLLQEIPCDVVHGDYDQEHEDGTDDQVGDLEEDGPDLEEYF